MSIIVKEVERVFQYNERVLTDPDVNMSPEEVLAFYANTYPDLIIGKISYEGIKNEKAVYCFNVNPGTKG